MDPLRVKWDNFRGIPVGPVVSFPRITVIIGRNNVGKTSLYAPLLLLKQTVEHAKDPSTALLTRGPILDAGTYSDLVYRHETQRDVTFEFSIPAPPRGASRAPDAISTTFSTEDGINAYVKSQSFLQADKKVVERKRGNDGDDFRLISSVLPVQKSVGRPQREVSQLKKLLNEEQPTNFLFSAHNGLRIPPIWRQDQDRWEKVRPWFSAVSDLYDIHWNVNQRVSSLLREISYLGPLRALPQRTYRLAAEAPSDVGRDGHFAPEVVYRARGSELHEEVSRWLSSLGYGSLDFSQSGDEYFQLLLQQGNSYVNIAHSGTGVSQLLPMLVQGLTMTRSSTLIAQQPEIHLNPLQQSLVADFLISCTERGGRTLIETHSEHILLRIRRRIAEGELDASEVAVYYVEGSEGVTTIRRVPLGIYGELQEWPEGFFDDQVRDSFALARAQVHRKGNLARSHGGDV